MSQWHTLMTERSPLYDPREWTNVNLCDFMVVWRF